QIAVENLCQRGPPKTFTSSNTRRYGMMRPLCLRTSFLSILLAGSLGALLAGCGEQRQATSTNAGQPEIEAVPPPSRAVQAERRLIQELGAEPIANGLRVPLPDSLFGEGSGATIDATQTSRID